MRRALSSATCAVVVVVTLGFAARFAGAAALTYGVSSANNSSASVFADSVTFDSSGTNVTVTLTDTSAGVQTRSAALTTVFLNTVGDPSLTGGGDVEPAYDGSHDAATCDAITGWVWDPQQPNTPIAVSIYDDQTLLVTVTANQFRQDLLDAHIGNGYHGFTSPLPARLRDGNPHDIRVTVAGSDFDLDSIPKEISCAPAYKGSQDVATCSAIAGWAWDPQQPDTPIAVSIYDDHTLLATVTANQFRQDLLDAHIGNGSHGFTTPLPPVLKDGKPHRIRAVIAGSNFELANTAKAINCAPDPGSK